MLKLREQKGAFAPFVAILIVLLILVVGLVVDLGHIHNVRIELQRAVDAAALAGAGQLTGDNEQESRARAAAVAMAGDNNVDGNEFVELDPDNDVEVGYWNPEIPDPDDNPPPRFTVDETPLNAVRVETSREVDHFFFVFIPGKTSSTVTASAIAVNIFKEKALPFTLVSCIQSDNSYVKPGKNVCDVQFFKWAAEPTDTGGWTSLTYRPLNNQTVEQFFSDEGIRTFNKIIYGTDEPHLGLENQSVDSGPVPFSDDDFENETGFCGERNVKLDIKCGLGLDFTSGSSPTDPLDYGQQLDSLPRWDDKSDFDRILFMDNILKKQVGESDTEYETRLEALQDASDTEIVDYTYNDYHGDGYEPPIPLALQDERFKRFIDKSSGNLVPQFDKLLSYAGYPLIEVKTGVINSALQEFLEQVVSPGTNTFNGNLINENPPFNSENADTSNGLGSTLRLTLPVVFTGTCSTASFTNPEGFPYVGLSDLLVTRIWRGTNDGYDCGDKALQVQGSPSKCSFPDYNPPAPGTNEAGQFVVVKGDGAAIEGLIRPKSKDDLTQTGVRKIYLVE